MGTGRPPPPPASIKAVEAQGRAVANFVSMLCELAVVLGAVYLRANGGLSEENFMYVAGLALIGPAVSRVKGRGKSAGTAMVFFLAAAAIKKITLF